MDLQKNGSNVKETKTIKCSGFGKAGNQKKISDRFFFKKRQLTYFGQIKAHLLLLLKKNNTEWGHAMTTSDRSTKMQVEGSHQKGEEQ